MKLPVLLSVPHAGLEVPPEVAGLSRLSAAEIAADGDGGAREVYALEDRVTGYVTTEIARAFVDMNRAGDDIRKDGVIKTHTCWDVQVYRKPLSDGLVRRLVERYHRPYHARLRELSTSGVRLGIDCHTMAAAGPPVGPDAGEERPALCLSDGEGTLPPEWFARLAECLERAFGVPPSLNSPFRGGHIIRAHSGELPWVQLEMSRAPFLPDEAKRERVLDALGYFAEGL